RQRAVALPGPGRAGLPRAVTFRASESWTLCLDAEASAWTLCLPSVGACIPGEADPQGPELVEGSPHLQEPGHGQIAQGRARGGQQVQAMGLQLGEGLLQPVPQRGLTVTEADG